MKKKERKKEKKKNKAMNNGNLRSLQLLAEKYWLKDKAVDSNSDIVIDIYNNEIITYNYQHIHLLIYTNYITNYLLATYQSNIKEYYISCIILMNYHYKIEKIWLYRDYIDLLSYNTNHNYNLNEYIEIIQFYNHLTNLSLLSIKSIKFLIKTFLLQFQSLNILYDEYLMKFILNILSNVKYYQQISNYLLYQEIFIIKYDTTHYLYQQIYQILIEKIVINFDQLNHLYHLLIEYNSKIKFYTLSKLSKNLKKILLNLNIEQLRQLTIKLNLVDNDIQYNNIDIYINIITLHYGRGVSLWEKKKKKTNKKKKI